MIFLLYFVSHIANKIPSTNAKINKIAVLLHKGNFLNIDLNVIGSALQTSGLIIFPAKRYVEELKKIRLNSPNSCPFKGNAPRKPAAVPTPKIPDKITDPQEAHPIPISPKRNPEVPIPASRLSAAALKK